MSEDWTPGPWSVVIDDSGDRPLTVPSIHASEELDCAIVHWDGFWQPHWQSARGEREWNANARLIAAAPEMYDAAADALSGWRYIRQVHGDLLGVGWDRVEVALTAALAKARGEA